MEGFGKPPPPPSSGRQNANQEIRNTTENASAETPNNQVVSQAVPNTQEVPRAISNTQEVPRARVPDPDHEKKLKRILAAREYSKRYHDKQHQRIENLENEAKLKETEIAVTSPRVRYTRRTNMLLRAENDMLQQKIAICTGKLMLKEAEYKELLKERDLLKQRFHHQQMMKMKQAAMAPAVNPSVEPGNMASNPPAPPAQLGCQVFGSNFGPNYQPYNPPAGLDSATIDFCQFQAPVAPAQFNIGQPAGLGDQPRSDPAAPNRQSDGLVGFSEFTNELSLVTRPHIMPNQGANQAGDGHGQSMDGMHLDNPDDSQKGAGAGAGPSSFQFM